MAFQGLHDSVDDLAVRLIVARDAQVRFGVEGASIGIETGEDFPAIATAQQGPRVAPAGPLGKDVDRGVEPHGDRFLVEKCPSFGVEEGSAAGSDHAGAFLDEARDHASLSVTKILFAELFEHLGSAKARRASDLAVAVGERQPQAPRQPPAHGRLAGAHQADKHDRAIEPGSKRVGHARAILRRPPLAKAQKHFRIERHPMGRSTVILVLLLLAVAGALFYFSSQAEPVPTGTIEEPVSVTGDEAEPAADDA